jgi:hypothetical protein
MVIEVIDINNVWPLESEYYSPVPAYVDRPGTLQIAAQGMKSQTGKVHIPWLMGSIQAGKNKLNPVSMLGLNTGLAAGFIKTGQPFVSNILNH